MALGKKGSLGLLSAVSIGIGGMIGAGIFSILGVIAEISGNAVFVSFLIGGAVALLCTYSYAKLGVAYPSSGGAVEFLVKGLGRGIVTGGLNVFMWLAYLIAVALYARAFAGYAVTFLPHRPGTIWVKAIAAAIVVLFAAVNLVGAQLVGWAETFIVVVKMAILALFAVAGLFFVKAGNLAVSEWPRTTDILFGAGVLFIGYEGFGLITNAAGDMAEPKKLLPRALYLSVAIVIVTYVVVAIAALGNLSVSQLVGAEDYALAEAAKPFLGNAGFRLIAVAALFSTASAINATLFGGANVSYMIARDGQLPEKFSRRVWRNGTEGLLISTGIVVVLVLLFDLAPVAMMASAAFLVIYTAVNGAHLRVAGETGGNRAVIAAAAVACAATAVFLGVYLWGRSRPALFAVVGLLAFSFAGEWGFRRIRARGRTIRSPDEAVARRVTGDGEGKSG